MSGPFQKKPEIPPAIIADRCRECGECIRSVPRYQAFCENCAVGVLMKSEIKKLLQLCLPDHGEHSDAWGRVAAMMFIFGIDADELVERLRISHRTLRREVPALLAKWNRRISP